jgi:hypothetical protein
MRSEPLRRSRMARKVGDWSRPRTTAAASRGPSTRKTGGAAVSARAGAPQASSSAAAASERRAEGRRNLDTGSSGATAVASMTSLLFGRRAERRGAHRCANDVVVDVMLRRCNRPVSNEVHWEAGGLRLCKRRTTARSRARGPWDAKISKESGCERAVGVRAADSRVDNGVRPERRRHVSVACGSVNGQPTWSGSVSGASVSASPDRSRARARSASRV